MDRRGPGLPGWCRVWLYLYPPLHRRVYGDEMLDVLRHRYHQTGSGVLARWAFHVGTAAGLTPSALGVGGASGGRGEKVTGRERLDGSGKGSNEEESGDGEGRRRRGEKGDAKNN